MIAHYESEAKGCVRISPQVIPMLPNALLPRNFQMKQVVVLL